MQQAGQRQGTASGHLSTNGILISASLLLVMTPACVDLTGNDNQATDVDPYCHYDCFGHHQCVDGVVTTYEHAPVPCEYWTGACPVQGSIECEQGCRADGVDWLEYFEDPTRLCQEGAPKREGDPCTEPADCLPTPAEVVDGQVLNTYLACDALAGMCVGVDPPVVQDWLGPCHVDLSGLPVGAYGYVSTHGCVEGVCLISPQDNGCFAQGCTRRCQHDGDCPSGSVCQDGLRDWLSSGGAWGDNVCKPGPPNQIGIGLSCPAI